MASVHGGTGVFYQAIPAVGADGKKIMKLIPVKMIDGQFFKTQINKPKADVKPQKAVTINIASASVHMLKTAALNPSSTQQVNRKEVSQTNTKPHQAGLDLQNPVNKHQLQQRIINMVTKVPQTATTCETSVKLPSQFPVTVKSPALPTGQYLLIPPNAQIRMVPASELPPLIKNQIFTSSASSSPGSGLPSVVYVSPIATVNQGTTPPSDSARHSLKLPSKTSNKTLCEPQSTASKPHLKLIQKSSPRSNSPIKWTIVEEEGSTALPLDPLHTPSVTSEILRAVAEREKANNHSNVSTKPASQSNQDKCEHRQENALVMYNGKVFFVAKKSSPTTAETKCHKLNKTMIPLSQPCFKSVAPEIRPDLGTVIPAKSDEVIDLCDDDTQQDSSQQAASAGTHLDEDNVIFVSYVPPKPECGSAQHLKLNTQTALAEETDQMGTSSSSSVTQQKGLDEISPHRGGTPGQDVTDSTVKNLKHVCGSAVMNVHCNEHSDSQQSTSTQQLENMEVDVASESPADPSSEICSRIEEDTHRMESSMNSISSTSSPNSCQMADHVLRKMFGITDDVQICLQRIEESEVQELSADPATSSPHTHSEPLKCSHFRLNTTPPSAVMCNSGQSSLQETPCDVKTEPVGGYVEPIDDDFLSTDGSDLLNSQDTDTRPQTHTFVDLNTNTRKMGRTRKRTICPCCIPGAQDPVVKSSSKAAEPEKWAWRKAGRTKAVKKFIKTSGKINCSTANNKQNCNSYEVEASGSLSTTSMNYIELKQQEEIRRLKELLREKEAALEQLRSQQANVFNTYTLKLS